MNVTFHGAAREVTGSCHLLRVNEFAIALDCGLFQGRRMQSDAKNRELPVPVDELDAVVLSHAHMDHSGRLPFLARSGYTGPIFATPATRDLCAVMLEDSAHIQAKDAEYLAKHHREFVSPLYEQKDVAAAMQLMLCVPYGRSFDVVPGVRATFDDAGHILGSASVVLDCTEKGTTRRLVFSGDVGRNGLAIIGDPQPPAGADAVIMESTYGNRDHPAVTDTSERLGQIVRETAARGGRILIPAFAVGRTQEIIFDLHVLLTQGKIPPIPIFVDSPLAISATTVFALHPELFDRREPGIAAVGDLFHFDGVRYTREVTESKALNTQHGPMIVIAASGMAESGRILHHLAYGAPDPRNTVLIVGFQAEHTLGRRIVERQPELKIFGQVVPLRAGVEILNGYSAHGDRTELQAWLDAVRGKSRTTPRVWLVHGEPDAQTAFAERLGRAGYSVDAPERGATVEF